MGYLQAICQSSASLITAPDVQIACLTIRTKPDKIMAI